ncbi:hypothetical protein FQA39_LY19019 [Lamprigera yunnana]|nr:hypothetical protein FQA39_LY19019 [Lamprigera yunnana]
MPTKDRLVDVDDSQFRTTITEQALASCSGAFITSLFVTPLDVVKIRLQTQQTQVSRSRCFLYCNGLMDHFCACETNGLNKQWFERPGHFNGTIVLISL